MMDVSDGEMGRIFADGEWPALEESTALQFISVVISVLTRED